MRWWPQRREQLVVARRYVDVAAAEEGWSRLIDAEIPATLVQDPGPLGAPAGVEVMVPREHLAAAQAVLAAAPPG